MNGGNLGFLNHKYALKITSLNALSLDHYLKLSLHFLTLKYE